MGTLKKEKVMNLREVYNALLLIGLAFLFISALVLFAAASNASGATHKELKVLEPCKEGLDLSVRYQSVQAVAPAQAQTLKLRLGRGGSGEVEKADKKKIVKPEACEAWQKFAWPAVDRMIAQSKSKARRSFQCINEADIQYKMGARSRAARVCLGDASQDGLTKAFYEFWDQTGALGK